MKWILKKTQHIYLTKKYIHREKRRRAFKCIIMYGKIV